MPRTVCVEVKPVSWGSINRERQELSNVSDFTFSLIERTLFSSLQAQEFMQWGYKINPATMISFGNLLFFVLVEELWTTYYEKGGQNGGRRQSLVSSLFLLLFVIRVFSMKSHLTKAYLALLGTSRTFLFDWLRIEDRSISIEDHAERRRDYWLWLTSDFWLNKP